MENILSYFINEPERQFHVRELARLTSLSPATTSKYLHQLEKEKFITKEKKLNHLFFQANTTHPLFKLKKQQQNIEQLHKSGLMTFLEDQFNQPQAIILFGSFAKAENTLKSDIDILIITPIKKQVNVSSFEKKLHHQIQIFTHSKDELKKMQTTNKELLNTFINGMILTGYWELFI